MAIKKATNSAAWNSVAWQEWDGSNWIASTTPVAGDYVYANGFSVTITNGLNIGTGTLSNAGRDDIGVTAGGRFYIALSGNFNITANIEGGMSGSYATIQKADGQSTGHTTTITGNLRTVVDGARCYADVGSQSLTSYVITGNIDLCDNSSAVRSSNTGSFTLNGNVTTGTGCIVCSSGYRGVFKIVGNVTMNNSILLDGYASSTIEISGNVTLRNGARFSNTTNTTTIPRISLNNYDSDTNFTTQGATLVEVNGNFVQRGNNTKFSTRGITTMSIYGTTTLYDTAFISGTINYLTLIGNLTYEDNPTPLGNLISLTVGDEFEIHCISSGSNDIIMISRYQLNNTNQYPAESNVKKDVPYAFGEKIGTYLPDYPPETVVLKDYVYDGGEMVGTLEQTVINTNTINIYKR